VRLPPTLLWDLPCGIWPPFQISHEYDSQGPARFRFADSEPTSILRRRNCRVWADQDIFDFFARYPAGGSLDQQVVEVLVVPHHLWQRPCHFSFSIY